MAVQNTRYTPARRGPAIGDGAGGSSERKSARQRDRVLEVVGHRTEDIRLTAGGTDVSAGESAAYNFGLCDKASVGRYLFKAQSAASATAEPLGADVENPVGGFVKILSSIGASHFFHGIRFQLV